MLRPTGFRQMGRKDCARIRGGTVTMKTEQKCMAGAPSWGIISVQQRGILSMAFKVVRQMPLAQPSAFLLDFIALLFFFF